MAVVKTDLISKINQLIEGNYDTPLCSLTENDKTFLSLERLRIKLRETRMEALESERATDEMIASVAHDLKTPIAIISGYAECIEAGMTDKDYPALLMAKAEEMNAQVISIVDAHKNRRYLPAFECVGKDFFKAEFDKHAPLATDKGQVYKVKNLPNVSLFIDKAGMSAVIQNVVSNAIKYTDEKGKITLKATKTLNHLILEVKDTGRGISKEDLHKIFDKFYIADKARSDSKSSGLGLYTAKETVLRHGGDISVKSKAGKGTAFKIKLPLENAKSRGFDRLPKAVKMLIMLLGYPVNSPFIYRMCKAVREGNRKRILSTVLAFPVFYLVWLCDMATLLVDGKIYF